MTRYTSTRMAAPDGVGEDAYRNDTSPYQSVTARRLRRPYCSTCTAPARSGATPSALTRAAPGRTPCMTRGMLTDPTRPLRFATSMFWPSICRREIGTVPRWMPRSDSDPRHTCHRSRATVPDGRQPGRPRRAAAGDPTLTRRAHGHRRSRLCPAGGAAEYSDADHRLLRQVPIYFIHCPEDAAVPFEGTGILHRRIGSASSRLRIVHPSELADRWARTTAGPSSTATQSCTGGWKGRHPILRTGRTWRRSVDRAGFGPRPSNEITASVDSDATPSVVIPAKSLPSRKRGRGPSQYHPRPRFREGRLFAGMTTAEVIAPPIDDYLLRPLIPARTLSP